MSEWHSERSEFQYYVEQAHEARAAAMARVVYLAVAAVGRGVSLAAAGLPRTARSALRALAAWRNRRAALREILLLDERLLQDIGLTRAEAWAAVNGTLRDRALEPAPLETPAYYDIALSDRAIAGCNDNGERLRAA